MTNSKTPMDIHLHPYMKHKLPAAGRGERCSLLQRFSPQLAVTNIVAYEHRLEAQYEFVFSSKSTFSFQVPFESKSNCQQTKYCSSVDRTCHSGGYPPEFADLGPATERKTFNRKLASESVKIQSCVQFLKKIGFWYCSTFRCYLINNI